jgi:FkbM family methyltransferase
VPGTRPVRLRYVDSANDNARYDALQLTLLSNGLNEGDTAIDVGAHCGQYALPMAAFCGLSGRVIAFEPDPYARSVLLRNIALNPDIRSPTIERAAVSDKTGEAVLYSRGGNSQSSLAKSAVEFSPRDTSERIRVELISLDGYLRQHDIATPRWVKIDAEGAEIRILQGAKHLLRTDANVICELHPYAWAEFGSSFDELKQVVSESGRGMRYLDQTAEIGSDARYGTVILERLA